MGVLSLYKKKLTVFCLLVLALTFFGGFRTEAAESANVKDFLDYLTAEEVSQLQDTADRLKTDYGLEPVIVITDNVEGKSSMVYADDYYDYNGYGVGADKAGLLMLINMADRDVWISTTGKAIDIFTDNRINSMLDGIVDHLPEGDYSAACNSFMADVENYAAQGVPSGQYRVEQEAPYRGTYWERALGLMTSPLVIIIPILIAIAATVIITLSNKGRVTVTPQTYEEMGSFVVTREVNDFVREHLTQVKIERDSGSGSSTHMGGSGSSHGGGGRGF